MYSNVTYLASYGPPRTVEERDMASFGKVKEGDKASFFCSEPRTGGRGENVSPPTTCLQKGQEWSGVP